MKRLFTVVAVLIISVVLFAQNAPEKKQEKKPDNINLLGNKEKKDNLLNVDGMQNPPVQKQLFWIIFAVLHLVLFLVFFMRHLKIKKHRALMQKEQEAPAPLGEAQLKNRLAALASEEDNNA